MHWQLERIEEPEVNVDQINEEDNNDVVDADDDDVDGESGRYFFVDGLVVIRSEVWSFWCEYKSNIIIALLVLLTALYFAYFIGSLYYAFGDEGSIRLLWITCLVVICLALSLLFRCLRPKFETISASRPINFIRRHYILINWFVAVSCSDILSE